MLYESVAHRSHFNVVGVTGRRLQCAVCRLRIAQVGVSAEGRWTQRNEGQGWGRTDRVGNHDRG